MQRTAYRNFMLVLLMVILAFNFVDRLALGMVLENIKADLSLSDTQLGFLSGLAFALFYSFMGIPIARWADRGNRITIITLTTALWSVAVALCGFATGFVNLMFIRIGVAVGEAGCVPPAHSLIADYFTREERPRAVGIYTMGISVSLVFGYFVAGWLNQLFGWRTTFVILGTPGLLLAALTRLTLKEPRTQTDAPRLPQSSMKDVWLTLWANVTFRYLLLCLSVSFFFNYGVLQWQPTFFIRSYGLKTGEIGSWFALTYGGCGLLGNYLGGMLASRYASNNERRQLRAMAVAYCIYSIFSAGVYLAPNHYLAFTSLGISATAIALTNGPLFATIQTLVPAPMRAMSIAIIYLFANLIGMGLGPLAAGASSDALRPLFGEESLRYTLLALCPGFLLCMWSVWRAAHTVVRDIASVSTKFTDCVSIKLPGAQSEAVDVA